jgi:hypothetical protein
MQHRMMFLSLMLSVPMQRRRNAAQDDVSVSYAVCSNARELQCNTE